MWCILHSLLCEDISRQYGYLLHPFYKYSAVYKTNDIKSTFFHLDMDNGLSQYEFCKSPLKNIINLSPITWSVKQKKSKNMCISLQAIGNKGSILENSDWTVKIIMDTTWQPIKAPSIQLFPSWSVPFCTCLIPIRNLNFPLTNAGCCLFRAQLHWMH